MKEARRQGLPRGGTRGKGRGGPRLPARPRADNSEHDAPPRRRHALTHVGGRVEVRGVDDPVLAELLESALDVAREDPSTRAHVHGFHSYAARLHPLTAARLVEGLSRPGDTVLDPFMGSGTVLVEARLRGRRGVGVDVNPLAVELAHLKTRGSTPGERDRMVEGAQRVAEAADERRLAKAGPTRRYGREDRELYDVHMLLELDGLRAGIEAEPPGFVREVLKLVLSSILVKTSKKPGDTVERVGPRRLASGFAIRLFAKKAEELAARLEEFAGLLPRGAPPCHVAVDDARELTTVPSGSVDLVVTSPPYAGVYDYASHHAARLRWLGLDVQAFEQREIGARRHATSLPRDVVLERWERDFGRSLRAIFRTLVPGGSAVLVLADSVIRNEPVFAEDLVIPLTERAGLSVVQVASQKRPHFHEPSRDAFRGRPRNEHVFVLERPRRAPRPSGDRR